MSGSLRRGRIGASSFRRPLPAHTGAGAAFFNTSLPDGTTATATASPSGDKLELGALFV
jgi:hypothetical protein